MLLCRLPLSDRDDGKYKQMLERLLSISSRRSLNTIVNPNIIRSIYRVNINVETRRSTPTQSQTKALLHTPSSQQWSMAIFSIPIFAFFSCRFLSNLKIMIISKVLLVFFLPTVINYITVDAKCIFLILKKNDFWE